MFVLHIVQEYCELGNVWFCTYDTMVFNLLWKSAADIIQLKWFHMTLVILKSGGDMPPVISRMHKTALFRDPPNPPPTLDPPLVILE